LRTYEIESFLKSFFIFFLLLEILLAINSWYEYQAKKDEIEEKIRIEMKLCAYSLQCEGLETDFVERGGKDREENILYRKRDFYSYFALPSSKKFLMKVVYPHEKYTRRIVRVEERLKQKFLLYSFFAALVSLLFSIYALMPLRKALRLNEEFVKDILHDFNTPLSSMRINLKLFKKEIGTNPKIERLENNIESILSLQNNLQIFLKGVQTQVERIDVSGTVKSRIPYFEVLYQDVSYSVTGKPLQIEVNKDAFVRIVDNLLSNAGKYNRSGGKVDVKISDMKLLIEDTGKGIASPSKVFDRYYKEQQRGVGIGLHIVKKLCEEMGIGISLKSKLSEGTRVTLDLRKVVV
jgi:signal transduction histidine kinase